MSTPLALQIASTGDIHRRMREFLMWRDDWLLNVPSVDEEHKELARLLNRIAEYVLRGGESNGDGTYENRIEDKIHPLLEALGEHTKKHFTNEERLMRETEYPELEVHHHEHVTLLAEFAELMRDIHMHGLECLDGKTLQALKEWLVGHIVGADLKFGDYYHETRNRPGFDPGR